MQVFIPAAGLGTRLLPLTEHLPKALVEVDGEPLLQIAINTLVEQGVTRVVVNIHHFSDLVRDYLSSRNWGVEVLISDESEQLLDTGGGLKHASSLFLPDEPILIHNVDVLSRINFYEMLHCHRQNRNFATLCVSKRNTSRNLLFDDSNALIGWLNRNSGETIWAAAPVSHYHPFAFSGIAILEPAFLDLLPPCDKPYPIIPAYLEVAKTHRISFFPHQPSDWLDVGTPQTLSQAQSWIHSWPK